MPFELELAGAVTSVLSSYLLEIFKESFKKKAIDAEYLKQLSDVIEGTFLIKPPTRQNQIKKLIDAYENEQLVLVLGAGVSVEYGLPSWETLLQDLLLSSFKTETQQSAKRSMVLAKLFTKVFSPNPLIAARYLRNHYSQSSSKDSLAFDKVVRETLYKHLKHDVQSDLYKEIVQLCVAAGKSPNLDSIITYNYDDILENHLTEMDIDIPYKTISRVGVRNAPGELPIFHVHGFLPRKGKIDDSTNVTLSEDIYHKQYTDTYSWNNMVQLNKFRDCACLFIGLSLSDPNLRRLLDIAKIQRGNEDTFHVSIRKKYDTETLQKALSKILEDNPDLLDQKSKANLKLDESVQYLVQVIEQFETKDDLSFGISTIWVKDYPEIPNILKSIRTKKI